MNWLVSRALAEACSPRGCSDGKPSAQSKTKTIQPGYSPSARTTESSSRSPSGEGTSADLMADRSEAVLTSFLAAFPVKPTPLPLRERTLRTISGRNSAGSWQMSLPGTSMPRTYSVEQLTGRPTILRRWATRPARFPLARETWVATTFGSGIGYLHTPTTQGNYCAPSMQKHPSCRAWRTVFGVVTPVAQEFLMGWPIGWTDLKPLEMGKFQLWLSQHLSCLPLLEEAS